MSDQLYAAGALYDPAVTDATIVSLIAAGSQPICGDNSTIQGAWARAKERGVKCVLLPQLMTKYFPNRGADFQNGNRAASPAPDTGTCVSRATYRAAMLSYLHQIDSGNLYGRPVILAYEPIYGGGRMVIGKGRMGNGGGMYGAWAAEFLSRYGACARNRYGSIDLRLDDPIGRTDLARLWGNQGVPKEVLEACNHKFDAHLARTIEDQMDALACGFGGAFSRKVTGGTRDSNGMSRLSEPSAHCECVVGVFVAANGEDGVLMQNSWKDQPRGGFGLKLTDGQEYLLPQGCYGVFADDQARALRSGESWHFELKQGNEWR